MADNSDTRDTAESNVSKPNRFAQIMGNLIKTSNDMSSDANSNIALFVFDLIVLPITLCRLFLIYLWGSKYSIKGFGFLDVVMHADNPYFNSATDDTQIDTISTDYRVVIRDDSRLYPIDIIENVHLLKVEQNTYLPNGNGEQNTYLLNAEQNAQPRKTIHTDTINDKQDIIHNRQTQKPSTIWQASTDDGDNMNGSDSDSKSGSDSDSDSGSDSDNYLDSIVNGRINLETDDLEIDIDGIDVSRGDTKSETKVETKINGKTNKVLAEVSKAIKNIDSRIDLDGDSNIDTDELIDSDDRNNNDSESDTDTDESSDDGKKVDPIDALLQRARERNKGYGNGIRNGSKDSKPLIKTDKKNNSILVKGITAYGDDSADRSDKEVDSIIDNLNSVFE